MFDIINVKDRVIVHLKLTLNIDLIGIISLFVCYWLALTTKMDTVSVTIFSSRQAGLGQHTEASIYQLISSLIQL